MTWHSKLGLEKIEWRKVMKGLIYFMKWYVLTLSMGYGEKLNCIYLFLKYKTIHQLIRMLWHAFSN